MTSGISNINKDFSPNRAGDFAEYYAVTWLWDQGYEVFKNCGCDGAIDLIAIDKDGKVLLIDVKSYTQARGTKLSPKQKELGVTLLQFNTDTRECRFQEHKNEEASIGHRDEHATQYDLVLCDSES